MTSTFGGNPAQHFTLLSAHTRGGRSDTEGRNQRRRPDRRLPAPSNRLLDQLRRASAGCQQRRRRQLPHSHVPPRVSAGEPSTTRGGNSGPATTFVCGRNTALDAQWQREGNVCEEMTFIRYCCFCVKSEEAIGGGGGDPSAKTRRRRKLLLAANRCLRESWHSANRSSSDRNQQETRERRRAIVTR